MYQPTSYDSNMEDVLNDSIVYADAVCTYASVVVAKVRHLNGMVALAETVGKPNELPRTIIQSASQIDMARHDGRRLVVDGHREVAGEPCSVDFLYAKEC